MKNCGLTCVIYAVILLLRKLIWKNIVFVIVLKKTLFATSVTKGNKKITYRGNSDKSVIVRISWSFKIILTRTISLLEVFLVDICKISYNFLIEIYTEMNMITLRILIDRSITKLDLTDTIIWGNVTQNLLKCIPYI